MKTNWSETPEDGCYIPLKREDLESHAKRLTEFSVLLAKYYAGPDVKTD